jgi:hypothetical protein
MKRALLVVLGSGVLMAGLSTPALAASPVASCQGLAASSFAGQPGAMAQERRDAAAEAASLGITVGALTSGFARHHSGTVDACHAG